ncbi:MAG: hypothetical protein MHM6MM_003738 [Cercozoa sp. M6MM]
MLAATAASRLRLLVRPSVRLAGGGIMDRFNSFKESTKKFTPSGHQEQQIKEQMEQQRKHERNEIEALAQKPVFGADEIAAFLTNSLDQVYAGLQNENVPPEQKKEMTEQLEQFEFFRKACDAFPHKMRSDLLLEPNALGEVTDEVYAQMARKLRVPMGQIPANWRTWSDDQLNDELLRRGCKLHKIQRESRLERERRLCDLCSAEANEGRRKLTRFVDFCRSLRVRHAVVQAQPKHMLPESMAELDELVTSSIRNGSVDLPDMREIDFNEQTMLRALHAWNITPEEGEGGVFGLLQMVHDNAYVGYARSRHGPKKRLLRSMPKQKRKPGRPKRYW